MNDPNIQYYAYTVLVILGAFLALLSNRIPRNPLLGVRVGYSLASPRVWSRVNREAGIALAVAGLLGLFFTRLWDKAYAHLIVSGTLLVVTIALVARARRLLELESIATPPGDREASGRPMAGVRPGWARPLAMLAATAPGVIGATIAGRGIGELAVLLLVPGVFTVFALVAWRAPMFFYNPWIPHGRLAYIMLEGLVVVQVFLSLYVLQPSTTWLPALGGAASTVYTLTRLYIAWRKENDRKKHLN